MELPGGVELRPEAVEGELTDPENKEPVKSLAMAPKFNARKGFQGSTKQSKHRLG